jgi:hypothetical protein
MRRAPVPRHRIYWGTDWPHPQWTKRMMSNAEEVKLLYRYDAGDITLLHAIAGSE